jgi:hypothetical protein
MLYCYTYGCLRADIIVFAGRHRESCFDREALETCKGNCLVWCCDSAETERDRADLVLRNSKLTTKLLESFFGKLHNRWEREESMQGLNRVTYPLS